MSPGAAVYYLYVPTKQSILPHSTANFVAYRPQGGSCDGSGSGGGGDDELLLLLLLLLQFTNNTKQPKADDYVIIVCTLQSSFLLVYTLLLLGFSTVQNSLDLEGMQPMI